MPPAVLDLAEPADYVTDCEDSLRAGEPVRRQCVCGSAHALELPLEFAVAAGEFIVIGGLIRVNVSVMPVPVVKSGCQVTGFCEPFGRAAGLRRRSGMAGDCLQATDKIIAPPVEMNPRLLIGVTESADQPRGEFFGDYAGGLTRLEDPEVIQGNRVTHLIYDLNNP